MRQIASHVGLAASDRTPARVAAEMDFFMGAATATTSRALELTVYYILADPKIEAELRRALAPVMAARRPGTQDMPRWAELEKVPFLQACVKEGLRLTSLPRTTPRIHPDRELRYSGWVIPRKVRHSQVQRCAR